MATEKTSRLLKNLSIWTGDEPGYSTQYDAIRILANGTLALTQSDDLHATDEVRDCEGLVAVPGLIDAHVHLGLDPSVTDPFAHGRVPEDQQLAAMRKRTCDMLRAGVTTARDLGGGAWLELVWALSGHWGSICNIHSLTLPPPVPLPVDHWCF